MLQLKVVKKTAEDYNLDPRVRAIDELQRIAADHRGQFLGQLHFKEVREFYNLTSHNMKQPSFRPMVNVPQLQLLTVREASDLSDISPRVYIANPLTGKRDETRERAFQLQWTEAYVNYHLLFAILWSQLASVGFLQVGYDPFARDGLGEIWVHHRDPETVYVDPGATSDDDWQYVVLEDRMYPGQVRANWPETGQGVRAAPYTTGQSEKHVGGYGFTLPEGPMSQVGLLRTDQYKGDGRVSVRSCFIFDETIEVVEAAAGGDAAAKVKAITPAASSLRKMYPNGRLVISAGHHCVADGDNPTPGRQFPLIPIYGMPPMGHFYPPPPIKYSRDLQDLAGRFLSSTFENAIRVNNMVWFVDENTGVAEEAFGGLPGEIVTINSMSRIPEMRAPQSFPEHMVKMPLMLLDLQKELQGFTPSREGDPGAGNISADLYEASIFSSKDLTRMRGKLLARSVHRLAILLYRLMATHYVYGRNFFRTDETFEVIHWPPITGDTASNAVMIDEASLMPVSQAAMRRLAPVLRQLGVLSAKGTLEALNWPAAADEAARIDRDNMLAAMARLRRR